MTQFAVNTHTPTYWAESSGFKTGRDPMGHQNSSFVVYAALLPGITNLTQRIRFYGFYAWLLQEYQLLSNVPKTPDHHRDFIRRAELIIAFLMQRVNPGYTAIPGSDFVDEFYPELQNSGSFRIDLGADLDKFHDVNGRKRNYWKQSSGAFGQYYAGGMQALSLLRYQDEYYILTEEGAPVAEAFRASLSDHAATILLRTVETGILKNSDLPELENFNISRITPGSTEWQTYVDLLMGPDEKDRETYLRKESFLNYLDLMAGGTGPDRWTLPKYYFCRPEKVDFSGTTTSLGWYLYYALELVHVVVEYLFSLMLLDMKEGAVHLDEFIDQQVRDFVDYCNTPQRLVNEYLEHPDLPDPIEIYGSLASKYKRRQFAEVRTHSLDLILATYRVVRPHLGAFRSFLGQLQISDRRGSIHEWDKYIRSNGGLSIEAFFRNLVRKILTEHQEVAYYKMGNGEAMVHLFVIEHNHLIHVGDMGPGMTNPRLMVVKNMLEDLGFLNPDDDTVTPLGIQFLQQHGLRT